MSVVEAKENAGATKLEEGATKLDEGATKLHEGAALLHEIAATMGLSHVKSGDVKPGDLQAGGAATVPKATARITRLRNAVVMSGARAVALVKRRPLATLAAVGVAGAFIEVEIAAGLLVGIAVAAVLVEQAGPEVRQRILMSGRRTIEHARRAMASRRSSSVGTNVDAEVALS